VTMAMAMADILDIYFSCFWYEKKSFYYSGHVAKGSASYVFRVERGTLL
jgi:hypothetical protein